MNNMLLHFFEENYVVKVSFNRNQVLSSATCDEEFGNSEVDSYENSCSENSLRFASPRVGLLSSSASDSGCNSSEDCGVESDVGVNELSSSSSAESNDNSSPWKPPTESREHFSHTENSDSSYLPEKKQMRKNRQYRNKRANKRNNRRNFLSDSESESNNESDYIERPRVKRRKLAKKKSLRLSSDDEIANLPCEQVLPKEKRTLIREKALGDLVCQYCLKFFTRESALKGHLLLCAENKANCSPIKYGLEPCEVSPVKKVKNSTYSIPKPVVVTEESGIATSSRLGTCSNNKVPKNKVGHSEEEPSSSSKENNSKLENAVSDNFIDCKGVCPHCSKTFAEIKMFNCHVISCASKKKSKIERDSNLKSEDTSPMKNPSRKYSGSISSKLNTDSVSSPVCESQSRRARFRQKWRKTRCHIAETSSEELLPSPGDKVKAHSYMIEDPNNASDLKSNEKDRPMIDENDLPTSRDKNISMSNVKDLSMGRANDLFMSNQDDPTIDHAASTSSELPNKSKTRKYHKCSICTLKIEKRSQLEDHMLEHMNKAGLSCKSNRRSLKESNLKVQIKKEVKEECNEFISQKPQTSLNSHSRIISRLSLKHSKFQPATTLKEFRCRKCRKTFHRSAAYEAHKRSH